MRWDRECDVLVVGLGGAGGAAAITAHDLGAKVLVLEKMPEPGGNTRYSGGTIRSYVDREKAIDFIETICEGTTPRSVVAAFVEESSRNYEWLESLGVDVRMHDPEDFNFFPLVPPGAAFPWIPGADGIGPRFRVVGGGTEAGGANLWGALLRNVQSRNIEVLTNTPARELLLNDRRDVVGALAGVEGQEIRIRARKGVILTCGGFEYDPEMQRNYIGTRFYGLCNPGNTGDGIRMAQAVGADLWHMCAVASTLGYRVPDFEPPVRHRMPSGGYIYVDRAGHRFMDETGVDTHAFWAEVPYIDMRTLDTPRIPSYVIFDDDTRRSGPIAATDRGRAGDFHQWSRDNSQEVAKGWITSAGSIRELAAALGLPPTELEQTVARYNMACVVGYDADMSRTPDTLVPLLRPPFYGIAVWPSLLNTQGGPRRNERAEVLSTTGAPIPHLYSAGELGSLWHRFYPGSGNVSEALAFGRIAARNAVASRPSED